MDPDLELRMETRVNAQGVAALLLQRLPEHRRRWAPVASWGRCLEAMEKLDSRVLLEAKALREVAWKLAKYTAFARHFTMVVSRELRALLKVAAKAHPELQAILIDIMMYRPNLLVEADRKAPDELKF